MESRAKRGLSEQDCFAAVQCWLGLKLPGVKSLVDLDQGFPDEVFSESSLLRDAPWMR